LWARIANPRYRDIQISQSESAYSSIETTKYTLTKPFGQNNKETAVYGSKQTSNNVTNWIGTIVDVISQILEK
jgi:hypothetical protein